MTRIDLFDDYDPSEKALAEKSDAQDLLFSLDPKRSWMDFFFVERTHSLQPKKDPPDFETPRFVRNETNKIVNAKQLFDVAMVDVSFVA